jgi:gamma-glutamylcyclotransferase (GGCT)/AIG2-like uncharacterized protein YtfP
MSTPTHIINTKQTDRPRVDGLFVYGTLMPSKSNRFQAFTDLQPTTKPATLRGYKMYDLGSFPGIVEAPPDNVIKGEFIDLTGFTDGQLAQMFHSLDGYEGFPGLYVIHRVKCQVSDIPERRTAYTYVYNQAPWAGAKEATHATQGEDTVYSW